MVIILQFSYCIDILFFYFFGAIPAIRSNLLCRTPAQKDFTSIGAKSDLTFCSKIVRGSLSAVIFFTL